MSKTTLYVLIDQALGMWVPLFHQKRHVVHCHDFIALKCALGTTKENPISWTGRTYQKAILNGFRKADCFISVSKNTQKELVHFLQREPLVNEQVYNALDPLFVPGFTARARAMVGNFLKLNLERGYILHVGSNNFYKNRTGVIELYNAWRNKTEMGLPLLLAGGAQRPSGKILGHYNKSPYKNNIHFLANVDDALLLKAYQGASVLVYPSLAEGFGWPVAEAMATGCPVITTDEAPMNEVGGTAAVYIKRCPGYTEMRAWAKEAAEVLETTLQLSTHERAALVKKGLSNAQRFDDKKILDRLERIYEGIVANTSL
ncbi:glycosyltransferase family 4 protein [Ulvibacterium marinum]|uniref:glycosyltransferase family 4 protein n=1 Tax=Ulvibacterium marinum TaxID=2419782 RepID=UPI002493F540|nr:glycosyltransferase family 1 protein [Ulvibacterium marinum]